MTHTKEPAPNTAPTPDDRHILTGTLFRRRSSRVTFQDAPPAPAPEPVHRPAHVARMLALAHHLQAAIDRGLVADQAEVARRLGFTRARVTQLLNLTRLAPDIQEQILFLEAINGVEPLRERHLRDVVQADTWTEQRVRWRALPRR